MKKTVWIHIGMFKTGTSALQIFLKENRDFFERHGYFVPYGDLQWQYVLPLSLIQDNSTFRANWPPVPKKSHVYWEELRRQSEETLCKNIIISAEFFCDFIHPAVTRPNINCSEYLKKFLTTFFDKYSVKVIIYIREPVAYINSLYREIVKLSSKNYSFSDFINREASNKIFHIFTIKILDFYSDVFGKNNLIIKKYDRQLLLNNNIVSDFIDILGIKETDNTIHISDANKSIPKELVELKRFVNYAGFSDLRFNRMLSDILIDIGNEIHISEDAIEAIRKNQQCLLDAYGIDIPMANFEQEPSHLSPYEKYQLALTAMTLRHSRILSAKIEDLEKKITEFIQNNGTGRATS